MSTVNFFDDLIREYLLFRGFTSTLKAFEAELKSDKDKGFRVDKIVDQLCAYITSYDLVSLRDAWSHLDHRVFSRLEHQFTPAIRKLESSLLKMYVINTVQTNRNDKLMEFFEKMSSELQNQPEWKEWFVLPFMKSPEENPVFGMYFTKLWQDTLLVSLNNFLSVVFQNMPLPTIMSYEEDHLLIKKLTEENQLLRQQISEGQHCCKPTPSDNSILAENAVAEARELMDDFYIIAQETPPADTQSKRFRDIIRNFSSGLPASPILGRKQSHVQSTNKPLTEEAATAGKVSVSRSKAKASVSQASTSSLPQQTKVLVEVEASQSKSVTNVQQKQAAIGKSGVDTLSKDKSGLPQTSKEKCDVIDDATRNEKASSFKVPFILLSQDTYGEHQSAITHCKFNSSGSVMASSDVSGIIKIWSISPSPQTLSTVMSKSSVTAVDWASKLERLLLLGNKLGAVRLYDTKEKRTLSEIVLGAEQQIRCLKCNPIDTTFVCCTVGQLQAPVGGDSAQASATEGKVMICDMKTMKLEKTLVLATSSAVNSCVYNHNGQLLLLGSKDGKIQLIDMISHECIATWMGHQGSVYQVEFSPDETSCYSIGEDGKFIQWNVNATGKMMSSTTLHDKAVGPFESPEGMGSHDSLFHPVGKLFALDSEGRHVLTCSGNGGMVYVVPSCGSLQPIMTLGGHRAAVTTVDWFSAVNCGMCISASIDGRIKISTILAQ